MRCLRETAGALLLLAFAVLSGACAASAPRPAATPSHPLYVDRALTPADLQGRSLRELSLMRNWIFARAGQAFRRAWLRTYFEAQPWYTARAALDSTRLRPLDLENATAIARHELSITRDELIARRGDLLSRGIRSDEDRAEFELLSERLGEWESDPAAGRPSPLQDPSLLDSLLTIHQLDDFSRRDLWLLRNTVYARRGRPFASESLKLHFKRFAWYAPEATYGDRRLNAIDRRNIRLILSLEEEIGGPLSDQEAQRWYSAA